MATIVSLTNSANLDWLKLNILMVFSQSLIHPRLRSEMLHRNILVMTLPFSRSTKSTWFGDSFLKLSLYIFVGLQGWIKALFLTLFFRQVVTVFFEFVLPALYQLLEGSQVLSFIAWRMWVTSGSTFFILHHHLCSFLPAVFC